MKTPANSTEKHAPGVSARWANTESPQVTSTLASGTDPSPFQLTADKSRIVQRLESFQNLADSKSSSIIQRHAIDPGAGVIQRVDVDGVDVVMSGSMPQWEQGGRTYHLNLTTDPPHVTCEDWPAPTRSKKDATTKMHFFYKRTNSFEIVDATSGQRGKKKFSELPSAVQRFVADNYDDILAVQ